MKKRTNFQAGKIMRDLQNPDMLVPPITDARLVPYLRFSFFDTSMILKQGGCSRKITVISFRVNKANYNKYFPNVKGIFLDLSMYYNQIRLQAKLNYLSPIENREQVA